MKIYFLIFILSVSAAISKTYEIGQNRNYTLPSQVASLVQDGDSVLIDAGAYETDVCSWQADNLFICGIGGMAYMKSIGNAAEQKAIWVVKGNNTTIEFVEFSGCRVPDNNGAGIRAEGDNLTVRHCYFHDNEDGILGGGSNKSLVTIEFCEFAHNGHGDGYSHNLYITNIESLIFQFNFSHDAIVGHCLKSRAKVNWIKYNRISDEKNGNSSMLIDLPNGGEAEIVGNLLIRSANAENGNMVTFGLEGLINGVDSVFFDNNTCVNFRNSATFIKLNDAVNYLYAGNNIFCGKTAENSNFIDPKNANFDIENNLQKNDISLLKFIDPENLDFHLTQASPGIDGEIYKFDALVPEFEYKDVADSVKRIKDDNLDLGAFEYRKINAVNDSESNLGNSNNTICVGKEFNIVMKSAFIGKIELFDAIGNIAQTVENNTFCKGENYIKLSDHLQTGVYFLRISSKPGYNYFKKIYIE